MKAMLLGTVPSLGFRSLAAGGAGGVAKALELQVGNDVGVLAEAILGVSFGVESLDTGSHDDGPHLQLPQAFGLVQLHGPGAALPGAFTALAAQAALQAAEALFRGRLRGEAQLYFSIGRLPGGGVQDRHGVSGDGLGPQALLFGEGRVHRPLLGLDDTQAAILQEVVDGHCGLTPLGHGLDEGGRPQDRVAAGEDAGTAGDQGVRIHLDEAPLGELDAVCLAEEGNLGFLADGEDDHIRVVGLHLVFDIFGSEAPLGVEDPGHGLELKTGDLASPPPKLALPPGGA